MKLSSRNNYFEPKVAVVFFLGISSGLPFLLLLSTLSVWLTESGVSKTHIGLMAWVTLSYTLKFLWAPAFARYQLPILTKIFGVTRAWLLAIQILLLSAIVGLGSCDPAKSLFEVGLFATLVGFLSSCQDILVEGHRIDSLHDNKIGAGAGASVIGYRVGMLIASAGAMYLSSIFSWQIVYNIMASFILIGIVATLCSEDTNSIQEKLKHKLPSFDKSFKHLFIQPMRVILSRQDWLLILIFMLSFKASDTILNTMNMPFLLEIGFSKVEIAHVAKTFGIVAMIIGGICGGVLLSKNSLRKVLFLCMRLQLAAGILFILQAQAGHEIQLLLLTMGIENFTSGLSQVALIYYLTQICKGSISAILYAWLTSVASFDRVGLSMAAGFLADSLAWVEFFTIAILCSIPAIWILYRHAGHFIGEEDVEDSYIPAPQKLVIQSTKL